MFDVEYDEKDGVYRKPTDDLPEGYVFNGVPVFHDSEDCMGYPLKYYSRTVNGPDILIIGNGSTPEEATRKAIDQAVDLAKVRALPDDERMQKILSEARQRRSIYPSQIIDALEIIWRRVK